MLTWQSILSVMPPCPGMESPKSLILKPRLKPDAKKPPKGAMMEANMAITTACSCRHKQAFRVLLLHVTRALSGEHCQTT